MTDTSTRALQEALGRAQPIQISRTYQSMSSATDLGTVSTLLTPSDIARRSVGSWWHVGRPKYVVAKRAERVGHEIAFGIAAGPERYPDKCAACLAPATRGVVFETHGDLLPGGSGRSAIQVGTLKSIAARFNRAYGRDLTRSVTAGNWQRIWHAVPFCDSHDETSHAVGFGATAADRPWVAFRNSQYGQEFGMLNGVVGKSFVRRWWPALILIALLLMAAGVAATLAFFGIGTRSSGGLDLAIGLPLVAIGGAGVWFVARNLITGRRSTAGQTSDSP